MLWALTAVVLGVVLHLSVSGRKLYATGANELAAELAGRLDRTGLGFFVHGQCGALIMTLITTILIGHGAGEAQQEILTGILILVFVGLYGRERRVRDRV